MGRFKDTEVCRVDRHSKSSRKAKYQKVRPWRKIYSNLIDYDMSGAGRFTAVAKSITAAIDAIYCGRAVSALGINQTKSCEHLDACLWQKLLIQTVSRIRCR